MTKFINEENLAEAAKIIKQYVDENSGGGTPIATKPIGSPVCTLTASVWGEDKQLGIIFNEPNFILDPQKRNEIDVLPESVEEWANCGVVAISEEVNQLTFKCSTIPTNDLYFRVVSTEVNYVSE